MIFWFNAIFTKKILYAMMALDKIRPGLHMSNADTT
jgi:hypothetical protein